MSHVDETFFTRVGCMDGRVQTPVRLYGEKKFGAEFPDTITEAGKVGTLAHKPSEDFLHRLKTKLDISIEKHNSKGILVHGHQECAGNPVDDKMHKKHVKESVKVIKKLINSKVPVFGVFVKRSSKNPKQWVVEAL